MYSGVFRSVFCHSRYQNIIKNLLKIITKSYKKTITVQRKKYNDQKICRLRNLQKNNPKEYWKVINSSKSADNTSASLTDFYNFLKNINAEDDVDPTQDGYSFDSGINGNNETNNDEINQIITENEILAATKSLKSNKSLKNNKSSGLDSIVNEHIKSTIQVMIPIYKKLFNLILDTRIVPESWKMRSNKAHFLK